MRLLYTVLFLLGVFPLFGQELLLNGGMEDENICTEYKIGCAPEAWIATGANLKDYAHGVSMAHGGERCFGIQAGHSQWPFQRSFLRTRLLCGLRSGNEYRVSFFIKSLHPILDSIGIYFTSYDFFYEKKKVVEVVPDAYVVQTNNLNKKDTGWQQVSIAYTARGDEGFVTIGNFSRRDITGNTGIRLSNHFMVFLDDISMKPVAEQELLCSDWLARKEEIYAQNERHQFLDRLVRLQRYNKDLNLTRTSFLRIDTLVVPEIFFETNKAVLQASSFRLLDSLCRHATGKSIDSIVVKGHTDNTGTLTRNEKLSLERAISVGEYVSAKISRKTVRYSAYGLADKNPVADNQTPQGRQLNRRVEILLYIRD